MGVPYRQGNETHFSKNRFIQMMSRTSPGPLGTSRSGGGKAARPAPADQGQDRVSEVCGQLPAPAPFVPCRLHLKGGDTAGEKPTFYALRAGGTGERDGAHPPRTGASGTGPQPTGLWPALPGRLLKRAHPFVGGGSGGCWSCTPISEGPTGSDGQKTLHLDFIWFCEPELTNCLVQNQ